MTKGEANPPMKKMKVEVQPPSAGGDPEPEVQLQPAGGDSEPEVQLKPSGDDPEPHVQPAGGVAVVAGGDPKPEVQLKPAGGDPEPQVQPAGGDAVVVGGDPEPEVQLQPAGGDAVVGAGAGGDFPAGVPDVLHVNVNVNNPLPIPVQLQLFAVLPRPGPMANLMQFRNWFYNQGYLGRAWMFRENTPEFRLLYSAFLRRAVAHLRVISDALAQADFHQVQVGSLDFVLACEAIGASRVANILSAFRNVEPREIYRMITARTQLAQELDALRQGVGHLFMLYEEAAANAGAGLL